MDRATRLRAGRCLGDRFLVAPCLEGLFPAGLFQVERCPAVRRREDLFPVGPSQAAPCRVVRSPAAPCRNFTPFTVTFLRHS